MLLILFFILVLNIVAIALTYYCLSNMDKKDRVIFIGVGIAVIYALTLFVYWLSTKDVAIKEVSELGKNLITFLFVPINAIIILPILAKSYDKYKIGSLALKYLKNRSIILGIILVILLIIECSYFKDIQNSVVKMIEENSVKVEQENSVSNDFQEDIEFSNEVANTEANQIINTEVVNAETNQISNSINNENTNSVENVMSNTVNQID